MSERIFTLGEARALLPKIREITERYREEVDLLRGEMLAAPEEEREEIEAKIEDLVADWAGEVAATGAEPKGVWLVDFDSGDGYYFCWRYGEADVEHVHPYEGGFAARRYIGSGE